MSDPAFVVTNLKIVQERIARAARSAQRDPDTVRLVAVSKGQTSAHIREAYSAGQRDFGESYVQELTRKAQELADLPDLRFHLIGHLQRNKARQAVGVVHMVHSVDSSELALELQRRRHALGAPALPVLVEVNIGGEAQKHGVDPESLPGLLDTVAAQPRLKLLGLMILPPHSENPSDSLRHFQALGALRDALGGAERLPELSMGMSHDLEYAIQAGATMVRVGTAIFGERN